MTHPTGIALFERFFRSAAGIDVDKSDIRRLHEFIDEQIDAVALAEQRQVVGMRARPEAERLQRLPGRGRQHPALQPVAVGRRQPRERQFEVAPRHPRLARIESPP